MASLTETLLVYDLPLLAAANEQRGSAWIRAAAGVDVEGGVMSRDELIALKNFEQTHREELRAIWSERDQQPLLDLSASLKGNDAFAPASLSESAPLETSAGSLALTFLVLALALLGAATLLQFAANSDSSFHRQAGLIYAGAIVLSLIGWRFGRYLWRMLSRDSGEVKADGASR